MDDLFGLAAPYLDAGLSGTGEAPLSGSDAGSGGPLGIAGTHDGGDLWVAAAPGGAMGEEAGVFLKAFAAQAAAAPYAAKTVGPSAFTLHPAALVADAAEIAAAIATGFGAGKALMLAEKAADKAHVSFDHLLSLTESRLEAAKGKAADAGERAFEAAIKARLGSGEAAKDLSALVKAGKLTGVAAAGIIAGEAQETTPGAVGQTKAVSLLLDRMDAAGVKESQNEAVAAAYSKLILDGIEQGLKAGGKAAPGGPELRAAAEVMELGLVKFTDAAAAKVVKRFAGLDDTPAERAFLEKVEGLAVAEARAEKQIGAGDAAKWGAALDPPPPPDAVSKQVYAVANQLAAGTIDAATASAQIDQLAQSLWKPGTVLVLAGDLLLKAALFAMPDAQAAALARLLDASFNSGGTGASQLRPALKVLFDEVVSVRAGETVDAGALVKTAKVAVGYGTLTEAEMRAAVTKGADSAGGDLAAWALQAFAALGGDAHVGDTVASTKVYLALANEMSKGLVSQRVIGAIAAEIAAKRFTVAQGIDEIKEFARVAFYNEGYDAAGDGWLFKLQSPGGVVSDEGVSAKQRTDIALVQLAKLLKGEQQEAAKAILLKADMDGYLFGLGANGLFKGGRVMTDGVTEARDIVMADATAAVRTYVDQQIAAAGKPTDADIYNFAKDKLEGSASRFVEGVDLLGKVVEQFDANGKLKGVGSIGAVARFAADPNLDTVRDVVADFVGDKIGVGNPLDFAAGIGSFAKTLIVDGSIGAALGPVVSGTLEFGVQALQLASDTVDKVLDNTVGLVVKPLVDFAAGTVVDTVKNVGNLVKSLATFDAEGVINAVDALASDFVHNLDAAGQTIVANLERAATAVIEAAQAAAAAVAEALRLNEVFEALAGVGEAIFRPLGSVFEKIFDLF